MKNASNNYDLLVWSDWLQPSEDLFIARVEGTMRVSDMEILLLFCLFFSLQKERKGDG